MSLGIALVGIGLGAALDDPLGFPGSSATLGFLIALTGVSVVVLTLGIKGRASGFSGFLVVLLGLLLVTASAASRVEVQDGVGDRTWLPVPSTGVTSYELGAGEATLDLSRLDSATTSTTSTTPQKITVEMGAGDLTILVPDGLDTRVDASVGFGDITHRGGVGGTTDTTGSDRSTDDRHRRPARAGRRRRRARPRPDHHPGAVMNTPTTPPPRTPRTPRTQPRPA